MRLAAPAHATRQERMPLRPSHGRDEARQDDDSYVQVQECLRTVRVEKFGRDEHGWGLNVRRRDIFFVDAAGMRVA